MPSENLIKIRTNSSREYEIIDYDFLVLCTGSTYKEPIKDYETLILEQRKSKIALE